MGRLKEWILFLWGVLIIKDDEMKDWSVMEKGTARTIKWVAGISFLYLTTKTLWLT